MAAGSRALATTRARLDSVVCAWQHLRRPHQAQAVDLGCDRAALDGWHSQVSVALSCSASRLCQSRAQLQRSSHAAGTHLSSRMHQHCVQSACGLVRSWQVESAIATAFKVSAASESDCPNRCSWSELSGIALKCARRLSVATPNPSLERTRTGMALGPRGARGLSSASRAKRHPGARPAQLKR